MDKPLVFASLVGLVLLFARLVVLDRRFLHIFQLEGYRNCRFALWSKDNLWRLLPRREFLTDLIFAVGSVLLLFQIDKAERSPFLLLGFLVTWCGANLYDLVKRPKKDEKKALKFTGRAIRIFALALLLQTFFALGVLWFANSIQVRFGESGLTIPKTIHNDWIGKSALLLVLGGIVLKSCAAMFFALANTLLAPIQMFINQVYILIAERKLGRVRPTVVGITGSYGKTSTKFILESVLSSKYSVLKTPDSYNTKLGICKVINEILSEHHQVFVVEMGAFGPGEIKESCDLVHPSIGILTAIGPQHLERFGSIDNIVSTKYELIEALPKEGLAVFNADDARCWNLAARTRGKMKVVTFGLCNPEADVVATDVKTGPFGLRFSIQAKDGQKENVLTQLLGKPNVYNILAATTVALHLGVSLEAVSRRISALRPIPHRLELKRANGMVIIDDAYNSNPEGAKAALQVLADMEGSRKILITPGMVELGELESTLNERFGELAAATCDIVFLVGPARTSSILEGLRKGGFEDGRIHVVNTLREATDGLRRAARSGDIVLIENDLPDTYEY